MAIILDPPCRVSHNHIMKTTIDQELSIEGTMYWLRAEVEVDGYYETSEEARECWGQNVFERVTFFIPTGATVYTLELTTHEDVPVVTKALLDIAGRKAVKLAKENCNE